MYYKIDVTDSGAVPDTSTIMILELMYGGEIGSTCIVKVMFSFVFLRYRNKKIKFKNNLNLGSQVMLSALAALSILGMAAVSRRKREQDSEEAMSYAVAA